MKIFVFLALFVLAAVALFIGLHFYLGRSNIVSPTISQEPVTQEPVSLTLNLSSPNNNQLVFDPNLLVQGQTESGTVAILSSENTDLVLDINDQGNFSTTTKLLPGLNQLTLTVFDNQGNSKSEARTIYYSTEKI